MANVKVSPPRVVLRWGNHCHRHPDAYGSQFEKTSFGGRFASSFAFFACSGATTENNVRTDSTGDEPGWGEYAQVNRPELDSATELVTLTAGGNDLRFPAVMRDCHVFFGYCSSDIKNEVNSKVTSDAFRRDLYLTYKAIKSTTGPHTTIVVMGYPQLFPDEFGDYLGETGQNCENLLGYNPADMDWMNGVVDLQNAALQEAASAGGVFFKPAANTTGTGHFDGHEVCGSDRADWVNGPMPHDFSNQADTNGVVGRSSFHPNSAGHQSGYETMLLAYLNSEISKPGAVLNPTGMPKNPTECSGTSCPSWVPSS